MSRRTAGVVGLCCLAAAAAIVVSLVLAGGGADPAGWTAPQAIPSARPSSADTAITGDGTVLAAWSEERRGQTAVMFSERPPGGEWSPPAPIQEPQRWMVSGPSLAVDARGDAVVVFSYRSRQTTILLASYRPAGGAWEAAQALAPATRGFFETTAGLAEDGAATVAWALPFSQAGVFAGARGSEGPWTDPVMAGGGGRAVTTPHLVVGPGGRALLAAIDMPRGRGAKPALRAFSRAPDGAWTSLPSPDAGPGWDGGVAVATGAAGRPTMAWTRTAPGGRTTLWASRLDSGAWSAPHALDRAPGPAWFGALAAAPGDKGVTVAWTRWTRMWTRAEVSAATSGADGVGPARSLDAFDVPDIRGGLPDTAPGPPPGRVLIATGGSPVVMWDRLVTREPSFSSDLVLSRAAADGTWSAPEPVTTAPVSGLPLSVGHAGEGLVVTWAEYVSPATGGVRVAAAERPD